MDPNTTPPQLLRILSAWHIPAIVRRHFTHKDDEMNFWGGGSCGFTSSVLAKGYLRALHGPAWVSRSPVLVAYYMGLSRSGVFVPEQPLRDPHPLEHLSPSPCLSSPHWDHSISF